MSVHDEVLKANEAYAAAFGDKSELALPPARSFAILTCMDARLDPAEVRRAGRGGRARDPQRRAAAPATTPSARW